MNLTKSLALGMLAGVWMLSGIFFAVDAWLTLLGLPIWQSFVMAGIFFVAAKFAQLASNKALAAEVARLEGKSPC